MSDPAPEEERRLQREARAGHRFARTEYGVAILNGPTIHDWTFLSDADVRGLAALLDSPTDSAVTKPSPTGESE